MKEMEWFINAAKPFRGLEINVLSETIPTHEYESKVLTKAFEEITGIKVNHQLLGEGEVVQAVQTQMQTNRNLYDAYINDSRPDRHALAPAVGGQPDRLDGRRRQGRDRCRRSTSRTSSASLHHRARRQALAAARPAVRQPLLVPQGLVRRARAEGAVQGQVRLRPRRAGQLVGLRGHRRVLHACDVKEIDGKRIYGHMDYGKRAPGPRLAHDRRLAVDGRRRARRACRTAARSTSGASAWRRARATRRAPSVSRGGETNGPASVYAIAKWDEWLRKYAPPGAADYDFYQSLPALAQGNVAQQIFWYTAFTASMVEAEEGRQQHRRRRGQPAVAHGAVAARARTGRKA